MAKEKFLNDVGLSQVITLLQEDTDERISVAIENAIFAGGSDSEDVENLPYLDAEKLNGYTSDDFVKIEDLEETVVGEATKTTFDSLGNNIAETYATKESVDDIVDGTTVVGNADTVDGLHASEFLKQGGRISTMGFDAEHDLWVDIDGSKHSIPFGWTRDSLRADLAKYLPLDGGKLTASYIPLQIDNATVGATSVGIGFLLGGVEVGNLGFDNGKPIYFDSAKATAHDLLHTGNIESYALSLSDAQSSGINNNLCASVSIGNNISISDVLNRNKVTFFTNWHDATNFPNVYGSGVVIPCLDGSCSTIFYSGSTLATSSGAWIGKAKKTDGVWNITWTQSASTSSLDNLLPLDGSKSMSGKLMLGNGYGLVHADNTNTVLMTMGTANNTTTGRQIRLQSGSTIAEAIKLQDRVNGTNTEYDVLHTGNYKTHVTPANIGAADSSHNHSAANITSGTLSVARGGTGATDAATARTNLGLGASAEKGVTNITAVGTLGYASSTASNLVPTISTMAFWNGAYTGTNSNLAYCVKGAFGTIVTKNAGDYLPISGNSTITTTAFQGLTLKRSDTNGSALQYSNSSKTLGNAGFLTDGNYVINSGTGTTGTIMKASTTAAVFPGTVTVGASTAYTTNQVRNTVFTTTDPGAGASTTHANGSIICVYE